MFTGTYRGAPPTPWRQWPDSPARNLCEQIAERMADRIGVISDGRLIAEGSLRELRELVGRGDSNLEDMFLTIVAQNAAAA